MVEGRAERRSGRTAATWQSRPAGPAAGAPRAPAIVDLRGDPVDPDAPATRIRYAVFVVRVVAVAGTDQDGGRELIPEVAGVLAERWAAVRHPPDALIRVGRSEFCVVCASRDGKHAMDVVEDLRAAAAVPVRWGSLLLTPLLSIRILFSRF